MRSVLVLVLAAAFYTSVKCEDNLGFGYELLTAHIEQLNLNLKTGQQLLERHILLLQAMLESKIGNIEQQMSRLYVASVRNKEEMKQLKSNQKDLLELCKNDEQQTTTTLEPEEGIDQQTTTLEWDEQQTTTLEPQEGNKQQTTTLEDDEQQTTTLEPTTTTLEPQVVEEKPCLAQNDFAVHSKHYKWVPWTAYTALPDNAVRAGREMYVVRIKYKGGSIFGKADLRYQKCYFSFGSREVEYFKCEVLTGSRFSWVEYSGGCFPVNAIPGGRNANGDLVYIGRVPYRSESASGTIDGRSKILSIPYGGKGHKYDKFNVLILNSTLDGEIFTSRPQLNSNQKDPLELPKKDEQQTTTFKPTTTEQPTTTLEPQEEDELRTTTFKSQTDTEQPTTTLEPQEYDELQAESIEPQQEKYEQQTTTLEPQKEDEQKITILDPQLDEPCSTQNGLNLTPADCNWVSWTANTTIPNHAVLAGDQMYVARVKHNGNHIVGKAHLLYQECYIPIRGKEVHYRECKILTGARLSWVKYSGGAWPTNAFLDGPNLNGDVLYVGRVFHRAAINHTEPATGTIEGRSKILSIPYGTRVYKYDKFDVLVVNFNCGWVKRYLGMQ